MNYYQVSWTDPWGTTRSGITFGHAERHDDGSARVAVRSGAATYQVKVSELHSQPWIASPSVGHHPALGDVFNVSPLSCAGGAGAAATHRVPTLGDIHQSMHYNAALKTSPLMGVSARDTDATPLSPLPIDAALKPVPRWRRLLRWLNEFRKNHL